jgi:hypothetical protein
VTGGKTFDATLGFIAFALAGYIDYGFVLQSANQSRAQKMAGWSASAIEDERRNGDRLGDRKYMLTYIICLQSLIVSFQNATVQGLNQYYLYQRSPLSKAIFYQRRKSDYAVPGEGFFPYTTYLPMVSIMDT